MGVSPHHFQNCLCHGFEEWITVVKSNGNMSFNKHESSVHIYLCQSLDHLNHYIFRHFKHFIFMEFPAWAKKREAPTFIKMSCGSPGCTFLVSQMTLQSLHRTKTWVTGGPPTGKSGKKKLNKFTLPMLTMSVTNYLNV